MSLAFSVRIQSWSAAREEASRVRLVVFVAEQQVPQEIELDEWDAASDHALAVDESGRTIATGRLLPDGHVGRMAVLREWRGQGAGTAILAALLARATERGMKRVILHAQTHACDFYARFGFIRIGDEFMEAGIPHVEMELHLGVRAA